MGAKRINNSISENTNTGISQLGGQIHENECDSKIFSINTINYLPAS